MTTSSLPVLDPTAAAIDVGSEQLHVSVAGGRPKVFGTTTGQLHELRDWLKTQGVRSVAMEVTGIYWLCPYEVLEQAGLQVVVVNGKYVKNLPGRKTDMSDCQWQATLHAHGLLKPGFVPPAHIRRLQDYLRVRTDHITMAGSHEQHMQKALDRMNLKIHDVISDLTGLSGLKMVDAIVKGERNPVALLALCDPQVQKNKAGQLRAALEGTWKEEHLFALRQAYELWQFYQQKIAECDQAIEKVLQEMAGPEDPARPAPPTMKRGGINAPEIRGLHSLLWRLCGPTLSWKVTVWSPSLSTTRWELVFRLISEYARFTSGSGAHASGGAKRLICSGSPKAPRSPKATNRTIRLGTPSARRVPPLTPPKVMPPVASGGITPT